MPYIGIYLKARMSSTTTTEASTILQFEFPVFSVVLIRMNFCSMHNIGYIDSIQIDKLNAVCKVRGTQISKKSRSHLKKLGARRVM
jgi:hypothetical protein